MRADASTTIHFLLASRQCELNNLHYLLKSGELVGKISRLIHMLQCERGASHLYLGAVDASFGAELDKRQHAVDAGQSPVMDSLAQLERRAAALPQSSRLFSRVASVVQALSQLAPLRGQIRQRTLAQPQIMAFFNDIIRHLLALVSEVTDTVAEPAIARALIAMLSFMQGKEYAGQERATGIAAFAAGQIPDETRQKFLHLIHSQERCFDTFGDFADEPNLVKWQSLIIDSEFERLRRIACTGTATKALSEQSGLRWFVLSTQRIDDMKLIEDGLEQALMEQCRLRILSAERDCEDQQVSIETLMSGKTLPEQDFSVFIAGSGDPAALSEGWVHGDGLRPQLGRSLLALIHQQDRRLQALDQELASMRQVLDERKQIDRAKGLLMQHQGISEQEAYNTLRRMAMSQNKKMIEIALAILTITDVLQSKA